MERILTYPAKIHEIPQIRKNLTELGGEWAIPKSEMRQILLIVEELFSNIVRFAYEDKLEHQIKIGITNEQTNIVIRFSDDGIPFNPIDYEPGGRPDPVTSEDGGMGLTLVKTFSDSMVYNRINGTNQLEVIKMLKSNQDSKIAG